MTRSALGQVDPWLRGGALALLLAALVAPVPAALLDVLLVANLAASLVVLVSCAAARPPRIVAALPAVLLGGVLARLALELAASRAILGGGGTGAVIAAFGAVAVRGDVVVGAAVFAILTVVQIVVVVQGGERVAEVAARFALDAMPGQQLAIDASARGGAIDARQARREREALETRAQRAGAMDGAMRFVKGDAVAGVVIVLVNLVAGSLLGASRGGLAPAAAVERYATLAIGQGLLAQVPSMLLAVAAALSVSRPHSRADHRHLVAPSTLRIAAGVMALVGLAPGLPLWPFAVVAAALAAASVVPAPAAATPDEAAIDVDDTERRLDALSADAPALVRIATPAMVSVAELTALRRWLADEGVATDDLRPLLEAIVRVGAQGDAPERWRSAVRVALRPQIEARFAPGAEVSAWLLGPGVEGALRDELARRSTLGPALVDDLRSLVDGACPRDAEAIVIAAQPVRRALWEALRPGRSRCVVLAPEELGDGVKVTVRAVLDPMG
ncbi:MAG: type secretion protein [Myxococcaceae bacterium]|nr:type secretion protein [Myxococcaceae bacterium]